MTEQATEGVNAELPDGGGWESLSDTSLNRIDKRFLGPHYLRFMCVPGIYRDIRVSARRIAIMGQSLTADGLRDLRVWTRREGHGQVYLVRGISE